MPDHTFQRIVEYGPDGLACQLIFVRLPEPEAQRGRPSCETCGAPKWAGQLGWVCSRGCEGRPDPHCPKPEISHPPFWIKRFGDSLRTLEQARQIQGRGGQE